MRNLVHGAHLPLTILLLSASLPMAAQVVIATTPGGVQAVGAAVNATTNQTYVTNRCGNDPSCSSPGTVTVINGATLGTTTVQVQDFPYGVAVNATTNKIFVANSCGNDITCNSPGSVTVIDGATNNTRTVAVGYSPYAVAVDAATNQIYVANYCGNDPTCSSPGTVTIINGTNYSTQTVMVGVFPEAVAVNATTNKIYVVNSCGNDPTCSSAGTVTVIDGGTLNTVPVTVGFFPYYLDIDSGTNDIYVSNNCGNDVNCASPGTVTAITGSNNNATTIPVGDFPDAVAVNSASNEIYVANECGNDLTCASAGTVTVINGSNNDTTTVDVGVSPEFVATNSTTNKIYVTNFCGNDLTCKSAGTVSVIDGPTNSIMPVAIGDAPGAVAVNASTNTTYVPNAADATVSVIGGSTTLQLTNVTPCRLVDTRLANGGGGPIHGGTFQSFNLPQAAQTKCTDLNLSSAASYSLNVTLIPSNGPVRYLTIWPTSQVQPYVSTMNSDGRIKADAAIVSAGVSGSVSVFVTDTSDVVLDIDGYFAPAGQSTLEFYPLTPCRIADTRTSNEPPGLGAPYLSAGQPRAFPVLNATTCFQQLPQGVTPSAYSFNFTAVPHVPLNYLTVWPTGEAQPFVSTLNAPTGAVTANAAIVPAGTNGEISTFAYNDTDLIIDINGYFAPAGQGGLSLYPTVPCRVLDTRPPLGNGAFSGTLSPPVDVLGSACGVPSQSLAYAFNATVVPVGSLQYLTLWPDGENQPYVSTLNAYDGAVTSNMAIVPSGNQGKIDAFAEGTTNLILDISAYFAP